MASISGTQVTPANQPEEVALQALESTEIMQVLTLLSGNLAVDPKGLTADAVTQKAIEKAKSVLGPGCVSIEHSPTPSPLTNAVTFTYSQCTGPFKHVSIDGTTTTSFELDVVKQQVTVRTTDDLVITRGGQSTPVKSTRTGVLNADGLALTTDLAFTDFTGAEQSLSGTLDVSPDLESGCVNSSIGSGFNNGAANLEINELSVCMDGNVCVGQVNFDAKDGAVAVNFDHGQVSFHFSTPNQPQGIDASLPIAIPSCVNVLNGVP